MECNIWYLTGGAVPLGAVRPVLYKEEFCGEVLGS